MKTQLEKIAAHVPGASVEEDEGYRDMRVFQIVAPYGKVWVDGGSKHILVYLCRTRSAQSQTFNKSELVIAENRIKCGVREMSKQERFECDEE